ESFLGRRVPGGVDTLAIDTTVLWLTAATALVIVLVFTVLPLALLKLSRPGLTLGHDRSGGESRGSRRARSFLIGVEVAASLTLLSGAALMVRSAIGMLDVDFGFEADRVATASLATRQRSYPDAASQAAFVERVSAAIAGIGGSTATGIGNWWPLQPAPRVPVRAMAGAADPEPVGVQAVTGGYFGALGIRTWDGRLFDARDTAAGEPVVVVSESLAGRMWAGAPAVGQSLVFHNSEGRPTATRRVIGVVNDVRQTHTDEDRLDAYVPFPQQPGHFAYIYVRNPQASGWDTDLREAVGAVDIEAATGTPRWLGVMLEGERAAPRFLARLLGVFAVVASLLALVGLHGVIAYATEQRRHEIAIRVAVGASPRDVSRLFVRQGALVLAGGVLAGVWGATALGRLLESYLHDVAPADPAALASAAALFTACGLAAIWWPARRAAAREPHGILGGN
ncbi:MAG TPA: FtsX-like permease family protein, partial [Vicinamibacterales bacterium]|nr:FtsX-like permease family protein [Vicinamibacterales bacterium]